MPHPAASASRAHATRPSRRQREQSERNGRRMLPSFKHRLAAYFLLLAVLPLTAAFWGFGTIAKHAEQRRVDSRLGAELRAAFASYERQTDRLTSRAKHPASRQDVHARPPGRAKPLASRQDVQRGLLGRRFGPLPRGVRVVGPHRLAIGIEATLEATRTVRVRGGDRGVGPVLGLPPPPR